MKLAKSLLLASAAGFAAFGAQAADLPSKKAAPVEYVKVCKTYGAGFFTIPGTETCVRFGGQLRSDVNWDERFNATGNKTTLNYRARITMDARTQTEIGLVRTFTQVSFANGAVATNNYAGSAHSGTDTYAFIQAGGFTGGQADSFFGYIPGTMVVSAPGRDAPQVGVFAYTLGDAKANFTLALQEPRGYTANTAGTPHPDVVARANFVFGNMGAYASAALHANPLVGTAFDNRYGYALGLGVFATNFAGAGSRFDVAGYYADGATAYLTNGAVAANTFDNNAAVAVVDRNATSGRTNTAWAVNGVATIPVSKDLNAIATAGYLSVNDRTGTSDYTRMYVGVGAQYTVARGLSVRPEVGYTWFDLRDSSRVDGGAALARLRVQRDF